MSAIFFLIETLCLNQSEQNLYFEHFHFTLNFALQLFTFSINFLNKLISVLTKERKKEKENSVYVKKIALMHKKERREKEVKISN